MLIENQSDKIFWLIQKQIIAVKCKHIRILIYFTNITSKMWHSSQHPTIGTFLCHALIWKCSILLHFEYFISNIEFNIHEVKILYEDKSLGNHLLLFKLKFYFLYIGDLFLMFDKKDHVINVLAYMNTWQHNIEFMLEEEL